MDTRQVSDLFENIKMETRFVQYELENRADIFSTMHIAISNH